MKRMWQTRQDFGGVAAGSLLKCVWMLAGVVDYKLCDRHYDCEHCPFDHAIRETASSQVREVSADAEVASPDQRRVMQGVTHTHEVDGALVHGYKLAQVLFYHPAHIWARVEDEGRVRIGLDDFGQKLVGQICSVKLPEPGMRVNSGRACWSIGHEAGAIPLAAPVTGIVQQVNEELGPHPSLINQHPYGRGWAMLIEPQQLVESLKCLYYGKTAEVWYEHQVESLRRELLSLMERSRSDVAETLQDGGYHIEDLASVISASQHQQIIDKFLSVPLDHQFSFLF